MIRSMLSALALGWIGALPLAAGDAFETPVRGEILTGWTQPDGTRIAALRLQLSPGWKTYWRTPGDAGIPPEFDWSGSQNLGGVGITWPAPEVFLAAGMRTIGYSGDLILPIALAPRVPGQPISLRAHLDIGVCSDICVPHQMTLDAVLSDTNTKPTAQIAAALAAQPFSEREAGVTSARCALTPTVDGLEITATLALPSAGGDEVVIIEPGQPGLWMSETETVRNGSTLVATGEMMGSGDAPVVLDRSDIRITVLGSKHAVDIRGCASD
ncbi:protein-disulfide reductase DsbD domain-containing protein [Marimonas sp. MJW-29]|uniref:Protein-disulfide reductase DsbD domain-containing protein n=1 Tax=Sulfitobacter sediminis TaxID=3234186 RepID=A0ABV3RNQ6_9RHOB